MNENDLECLAKLLDKNRDFVRPKGQVTGYSCEEMSESTESKLAPKQDSAALALSIPLPHTVVNQQLRLPVPSHSKNAEKQRAEEANKLEPHGDEIWSQVELEQMYNAQSCKTAVKHASQPIGLNKQRNDEQRENESKKGETTEVKTGNELVDVVEPEYRVLFQQHVRAEDVYLGVDFTRDNSIASSDAVVVKVELPLLNDINDVTIDLQPFQIKLTAPQYYLSAPLPTEVLAGSASAK